MNKNQNQSQRNFALWFWGIFIMLFVFVITLFILISNDVFGPMPSFAELENPRSNVASEVISEDHKLLGTYYVQNRTFVNYENLSPHLVNALIATEDIRFYRHSGIDGRGLIRVFVKTLLMGNKESGGGSTITQQLSKNLFPRDTSVYNFFLARYAHLSLSKFKEWITAVKLERNFTKNEIIAMYLNIVPFGSNAYGIKSAAKTFFNKPPDSLSINEAALLVGIVNAPTRYSPVKNPERSLERRNFVLSKLKRYGFINANSYDSLSRLPLNLTYKIQDQNVGPGTYFREIVRQMMIAKEPKPDNYYSYSMYQADSLKWARNPLYGWCNKNSKPDGTPYNLYKDGLKIYTTVNSRMQKYAEEAVSEHLGGFLQTEFNKEQKEKRFRLFSEDLSDDQVNSILLQAMKQTERYRILRNNGVSLDNIYANFNTKVKMTVFSWKGERDTIMSPLDSIKYYKRFFRAGFMAVDPHSGYIKAYVGGPNFKHFKYDHVIQGKRQVGSTIKPFLYTLAMQEGYSPCYMIPNVPQTFVEGDSTWTPKNSGSTKYDGKMVTLKWGLANSVNNISAWLIKQFTPQAVADIIKKMGVTSEVKAVNSIMLGTSEISVYEMVGAYSTFANKGVHIEPILVTRIEDKNGNVLSTFTPQKSEAISEQTAYLMINLMEGTINRGTGIRIRSVYNLPGPIAGKTGTSQNHSDGWFMGLLPNLVAGTWVGAEDRSVHFAALKLGQGASMALPIYALFLKKVYNDPSLNIYPGDQWPKPLVFKKFNLDCENAPIDAKDVNENDFF